MAPFKRILEKSEEKKKAKGDKRKNSKHVNHNPLKMCKQKPVYPYSCELLLETILRRIEEKQEKCMEQKRKTTQEQRRDGKSVEAI